jgi:hypothetical protein
MTDHEQNRDRDDGRLRRGRDVGGCGIRRASGAGTPACSAGKAKPASSMDAKCQAMMADHETMMTQMNAADQKLDGLVAKMNSASAAEMPAATASVVNEMATQRRTMRDGMMKMQEGMMAHMMEHMQAGPASMASCPMMKQMGAKKP